MLTQTTQDQVVKVKSDLSTIHIKGYAWHQTDNKIIIHLKLEQANDVDQIQSNIQERSMDITFMNHRGVNYNFRINQLYSFIMTDDIQFKPKGDKMIITLQKATEGEEWLDLKSKSTHTIYNQLSRNPEKTPDVIFLSPFHSPGNSPK